ncbi:MAG: glutamate racemase [Clostridiales Family XIII bacterium]|jgi:glutamate racemase|nr:glutamate racemase [Clostridiales Family XIII bacterium]
MDNRPIGFFDSGLGGLTCIPHLMETLPNERIIYFGDTARTPYGSKAVSTIKTFSCEIADFLESENVKLIVIACNTVSATCLDDLRKRHPNTPILGIISPASHTVAKRCNADNRIGIIGTTVTIESDAYRRKILRYNPDLDIYSAACPVFVPLIEEGIIKNEIMDLSIKYYLDQFISYNKIDTLVLGCTHYPLIRENILKIYPHLDIIDPSSEVLQSIMDTLDSRGLYADAPQEGNTFFASDLSENFINMINLIFRNTGFTVAFKNFDLERTV